MSLKNMNFLQDFDTGITMRLITGVKCLCYSSNLSTRAALLSWDRLFSDVAAGETNSKPKRYKYPEVYEPFGPKPPPSEKVLQLADRIAALPPEELKQIGPTLHLRLNQPALHSVSSQGFSFGAHSGASAKQAEEKKEEKTAFDIKLEKFDAAAKIKVIKEVRAFTNLGLKEAKELVEKAPAILKQGVTKEEANNIIEKIKAAGGVAVME